jgi:hypothetical protein
VSDDATIADGKAAWARLKAHQRTTWPDWCAVGLALKAGKDAAMKTAGVKTPFGKPYVRIYGAWLRETGFDGITSACRYRLLLCIQNGAAIEAWLSGLPESTRNKYAHPDSVWFAWRRAMYDEPARAASRPERPRMQPAGGKASRSGGYHRQLHFDQDVVRRVAAALREHWSTDTFKLATVVLNAAFPNEAALLALLPADPPAKPAPPKPAPRQIAAPVALEVHA